MKSENNAMPNQQPRLNYRLSRPNGRLRHHNPGKRHQRGIAVIGTTIVLLVIVSMVGLIASKSTLLETRMVFNMQDKQRASIGADSAATLAWNRIKAGFDLSQFINNSNQAGFYVLENDIPLTEGSAKAVTEWQSLENAQDWPWNDAKKRFVLDEPLGGTANPMKLSTTPQYVAGIHHETFRKGTANYYCIPVTVMGASQGATPTTRTLIQLRTIPKSSCYHEPIK